VLFSRALEHAFAQPGALLLEVGPGQALAQFAQQHPARPAHVGVAATLPKQAPGDEALDDFEQAWGLLWAHGFEADWESHFGARRRVALPTYPFERQRYWIDRSGEQTDASARATPPAREEAPPATEAGEGDEVLREVVGILADLSGIEPSALDPKKTFLELGFDSLFLTQASRAIQKKYLVKITLRQLLDTMSTPAAIAAHVAAHRPAGATPATQKTETPAAAAMASPFGVEEQATAAPPTRHGPCAPINKAPADALTPRARPSAPSVGREELVSRLYADLLAVPKVGPDDDFFALGGHSLLALKLINRLHEAGYALEIASLFRDATVRGVAAALAPLERGVARAADDGIVVQLREGRSDRPPLVLAPSDFGDLLIYANLLPHLDPDWPVIGLQCADFFENPRGIDSMQALARQFVERLRAIQPAGPYLLAGYCFGGQVALEMARILQRDGARVAFLGLIDARPFRPAAYRGEYLLMRLQGAWRARLPDWKRHLSAKWAMRREAKLIDRMARTSPERLGRRELNSWALEQKLLMHYRTTDYDGEVTFFYPEESRYALYGDPTCGWLHLAARVWLHKVSGSHVNMMKEPHARMLAARISAALAQAIGDG
jgi:thioesterase domain-containing protein/acyl carrier protein